MKKKIEETFVENVYWKRKWNINLSSLFDFIYV